METNGFTGNELSVLAHWADWRFPHKDWKEARGGIWRWRGKGTYGSNTGWICAVTGRSTSTSAMYWAGHWVENREMAAKWFKDNDMAVRYAHGDFREVYTPRNIVYMRCDLQRSIDCGELLVVPRRTNEGVGYFTLHATSGTEAIGYVQDGYHGAAVEISEESAPFVFARFAFTTIELLSRYKESRDE